jgi:SNF2 family DNA or RNA helicase
MTEGQAKAYEQMVDWQMSMIDDDLLIAEYPMVYHMRLMQLAQSTGQLEVSNKWVTSFKRNPDTGHKERVREFKEVISVRQVMPSPKVDKLLELLDSNGSNPTIVFSQFPGMVRLCCAAMDDAGISYVHAPDAASLATAEAAFQNGEADVIIGTVGIMGESIELSRATTIIFLDCPPNPRVRDQAECRAKAIGKREPITCIDIKTEDTVDFLRLDRTRTKAEWNDLLLGRGQRENANT